MFYNLLIIPPLTFISPKFLSVNAGVNILEHIFLSPGAFPSNSFSEVRFAGLWKICTFNFNCYF